MDPDRWVDLNADAGESFGRWELGDDPALLPYLTSVSVACGFHAGDPATMRRSVRLARDTRTALGAHPALPDLAGFGRRRMAVADDAVAELCAYQVGALQGIARLEGLAVEHVKPHGALYAMVAERPALARCLADALLDVDPTLVLVLPPGDAAAGAREEGIRVAEEAFIDIDIDDRGLPIVRDRYPARDPDEVADRAVDAVRGTVRSVSGAVIPIEADTLCLHGDAPDAPAIAAAVVDRLTQEGIGLAPMRRVLAGRDPRAQRALK